MSEVAYHEGSWSAPDSQRRFSYRLWRPPTVKALLVLVHGFGEHSGRYQAMAEAFVEQGLCVAVPDLWTHGHSGGARGDLANVHRCVDDLRQLTENVFLPETTQSHYALFGHSFGGLVAIHWAMANPPELRRVTVQSPLLEVGFSIPRWKRKAVLFLAGVWPTCSLSMGLDVGALSHDPAIARAYQADPLVHNAMSVRTYLSILQAQHDALALAGTIRVPVLLLYGTADRIISVASAQRWFDQLQCEKRCISFPGYYHELRHEAVRDEVMELVCQWTLAE